MENVLGVHGQLQASGKARNHPQGGECTSQQRHGLGPHTIIHLKLPGTAPCVRTAWERDVAVGMGGRGDGFVGFTIKHGTCCSA